MGNFLLLVILSSLVLICFQDFCRRAYYAVLIPIIIVAAIIWNCVNQVASFLYAVSICANLSFICLQLIGLKCYLTVRYPHNNTLIDSRLGLGDVLFFCAIAFILTPIKFIYIHLLGLVASILYYCILQVFLGPKPNRKIPLAGIESLILLIWLVVNQL